MKIRFEQTNAKYCAAELIALGNHNMKMWNIFQWLLNHDDLQHGTQAEMIKLYCEDELVAYSLFESFENRSDKVTHFQDKIYQDLGVVHFITFSKHQNKGYASQLANVMYADIIKPLLARHAATHTDVYAYVTATGRAVALMERTDILPSQLVKQFYSEASFKVKVVDYLATQYNH